MRPPTLGASEWCKRVLEAAATLLPQRDGLDVRVQYDVSVGEDHHRWAQVFTDGILQDLRPGDLDDADIEIHWKLEDGVDALAGRVSGTDVLAVTTIAAAAHDGPYRGPPPPMDIARRAELTELPTIKGASLTVQHHLRAGPFGDVDCGQVFVDGRLNRVVLGTLPDPDVEVDVPYRTHVLLRQGAMQPIEGLQQARVSGSIGSLGLYAGLFESDAFQRAQRACAHEAGQALATLGEIGAQPGFREAVADVTRAMVLSA